jgi:hypothetical protein
LRWTGKTFLVHGEHIFSLEAHEPRRTLLVHKEIFTGPLIRFFREETHDDIAAGFEAMNKALKNRAEMAPG